MRDVVLVERQEVSGLRWNEVRKQIPEGLGEMGTKGNNVEGRLEVARKHYVASSRQKIGGRATCQSEGGSLKKHRSWTGQSKIFVTMSPPTALC